jgi:hypothetical protein
VNGVSFVGEYCKRWCLLLDFWLLFVDDGGRNAVWDDLIELIYAVLQLLGKLQKIEDPLCLIERPIGAMDSSTLIRLELRLKQLYESYVYDVLNT